MSAVLEMAETGLACVHPDLLFAPSIAREMIADAIANDSMIVAIAEDDEGLCGLLIAKAECSWFGPGWVASD